MFQNYHEGYENPKIFEMFEETISAWRDKQSRIFTKFYDDLGKMSSFLTDGECRFILVAATMLMTWNNQLILNNETKKILSVYMGNRKINTIEHIVVSLCKKDVLKRVKRGEYEFNDLFFSKQPEPKIKAHRDFIKEKRKHLQKILPPEYQCIVNEKSEHDFFPTEH